jgi:hypothetical protein
MIKKPRKIHNEKITVASIFKERTGTQRLRNPVETFEREVHGREHLQRKNLKTKMCRNLQKRQVQR